MADRIPVIGAQVLFLTGVSESYSEDVLRPVAFKLSNLRVEGTSTAPAAPKQSKYIIAMDEAFSLSVDIELNKTPLSELWMKHFH